MHQPVINALRQYINHSRLRLFHPSSMIHWLTTFSVAVATAILILGGTALFELRADAWRKAEQASDNLVLALSRDIARNINLYDLSVQGVIKALAEPALASADPKVRQMALFDSAAGAEYLGSMLVVNAQGDIVADSRSLVAAPFNNGFREFFKVHQQRPDVGLYISRPFMGRLVNDWLIALTRRIPTPDGSFGGIVEGAMRIAYFRDLFAKLDIGEHGSVALFRDDGRIIMRRPFQVEDIDRDLSQAQTFRTYLTAPHGHFVGTAAIDKVQRLYTFHHIENLPLYLSVAVATDEIYADWWRRAISIGAILLALCGTSVVLCLLFRKEIQRRLVAEASLREAAQNLKVMAATDGLTGLANRRCHEEVLEQEWRRAIRSETPIAALMLDVDYFKPFNDRYGHQQGDEVLKAVASSVAANLHRPADIAARYGGEEFVALLPETELRGAVIVAETIRAAISGLGIAHAGSPLGHVSVSVGVAAAYPAIGSRSAALIKQADDALYQAKRSGRNRIVSQTDPRVPPITPRPLTPPRMYDAL